jgi:hypothetical protein
MDEAFKIPPKSPKDLTKISKLPEVFKGLVGREFSLTGKTRTDGANIRKLIANELLNHGLPERANPGEFEIVPPKKKGVPKMLRELIDSYTVTSGESYNLQVWNRIPNCKTVLIKYDTGETLKCDEVRYIFVKIDSLKNIISSIVILTAEYIERHFGKFGKPTIKHQLLISNKARNQIYSSESKVLTFPDSKKLSYLITDTYTEPDDSMANEPNIQILY